MRVVYPVCAGMDVHKNSIHVCLVKRDAQGERIQQIRKFSTMTRDLLLLADWLKEHHCPMAVMESTGVYWKPVFNILETELEVMLVNPAHVRNVPGRKTDAKDSEWLAELLEHGLLKASFVPPREIRDLRDVTRYRRKLVQTRASEIQRLEKVLEDCNIKLASVASDLRGTSARAILESLLLGRQTPAEMAELTKGRMRQKKAQMEAALEGHLRPTQAWLISQILDHLDGLDEQIREADAKVEQMCVPFLKQLELLDSIPGVNQRAAEEIIAEVGVKMEQFPDHKHLCSWAAVCPGNNQTGGKRKSGRIRQGNRYLRTILVQCAHAAAHTKNTYLSSLYRHFARKSPQKAAVAVGHAILTAAYFILKDQTPYKDLGADHLNKLNVDRKIYHHLKQLKKLGVDLFQGHLSPDLAPELLTALTSALVPELRTPLIPAGAS